MTAIHIQVKAREDLKKILKYSVEQWGLERAERYYDDLIAGISQIADNPRIGFARDDIKLGYYQLSVEKHFVFYRIGTNKIHIIRILHERMLKSEHF